MDKKLSKGQALLERLEEVINHADINSKQAIKSASFGIEQTVEILHGRKRKLEDTWEERKKLLEQSVQSSLLDEGLKKVCTLKSTQVFVLFECLFDCFMELEFHSLRHFQLYNNVGPLNFCILFLKR